MTIMRAAGLKHEVVFEDEELKRSPTGTNPIT
jgi:hypothetical protein